MAYYLVDIRRKCRCGKAATHALHTSGTAHYGDYCKKCGEREVRLRNKKEPTNA